MGAKKNQEEVRQEQEANKTKKSSAHVKRITLCIIEAQTMNNL